MSSHGTASIGRYVEFQSAVLRQLPRPEDITDDLLDQWTGNQAGLKDALYNALLIIPDTNWLLAYEKLDMADEYAKALKMLALPPANPSLWTPLMVPGLTCNKIVAGYCKEKVQVYTYVEDLDKAVTQNDRDPNKNGSYFIGFRRTIEADGENRGLSANVLASRSHKGITLLERLMLGFGYYVTTGQHLDVKCVTLCTGSRDSDGRVPGVCWYSGPRRVYVGWYYPGDCVDSLRSRSAVSLPTKQALPA